MRFPREPLPLIGMALVAIGPVTGIAIGAILPAISHGAILAVLVWCVWRDGRSSGVVAAHEAIVAAQACGCEQCSPVQGVH